MNIKYALLAVPAFCFFNVACTQAAPTIATVQADATAACGFLPTAETVTGIITAGNVKATAGLDLGTAIANAICQAMLPTKNGVQALVAPNVYGVPVVGKWVR